MTDLSPDDLERYRSVRSAYLEAVEREDAAFRRYFAKVQAGEPTNGAAVSRLSNVTSYLSADLAVAEGRLYAAEVDPREIDLADGIERDYGF